MGVRRRGGNLVLDVDQHRREGAARPCFIRRSSECAADEVGLTLTAASACAVARCSSPRIVSLAMASSIWMRAIPTLSFAASSLPARACKRSISAPGSDMSASRRTGEGSGVHEGLPGRGGGPFRGPGGGRESTFETSFVAGWLAAAFCSVRTCSSTSHPWSVAAISRSMEP